MKAQAIGLACLVVLAAVAAVRGQSTEAIRIAREKPEWYLRMNRLAVEYKWEEAISFVRETIAQEPPAADAESVIHHLAMLLSIKSKNHREDALEFYQLAIDRFPESPRRADAWCGIANVYAQRKPVDRESDRRIREQVIEAYERAFAIATSADDPADRIQLPDLAHSKLAEHYLAGNEWEKALPVLQSWRPQSWCGTCLGQMHSGREMGIMLCLVQLGRYNEAVVHAWRDVSPQSSLTESSFGPFVLLRLYSEAGQFGDLERQVEDYLAEGWREFPERRSVIAQGSANLLDVLERTRSRTLITPIQLLPVPDEAIAGRNPVDYQIARWRLIQDGDKSIPLLERAAHRNGKMEMQLVEVLAAIDRPAARDALVRLAVAGNPNAMQSICGLIHTRVRDPETLIASIADLVSEADKLRTKQTHYAPAPLAFRLCQPWTPPARGSLPKTFPQEVFAKVEGQSPN